MSKKTKKNIAKRASSLSFTFSRWYKRISKTKPSTAAIAVVIIGFAIFILGGALYIIINQPLWSYYSGSAFYFVYPNLSYQLSAETIISATLYGLGFAGLLAMYQSTKNAYNPRQAYILLIIGVSLLLVSYIALESILNYKMYGSQFTLTKDYFSISACTLRN